MTLRGSSHFSRLLEGGSIFASGDPKRMLKEISHHNSRWSDGKVLNPKKPAFVAVIPGEAKIASIVREPLSYVAIRVW